MSRWTADIVLSSVSLLSAQELRLTVLNRPVPSGCRCSLSFCKVEDQYDEWVGRYPVSIKYLGDRAELSLPDSVYLQPGLYYVTDVVFTRDADDIVSILECSTSSMFEVRAPGTLPRDAAELAVTYDEISCERDRVLGSGLGRKDSPGASAYECWVFTAGCLISKRMILGQIEVIPYEGLGYNDTLNYIKGFMQENDLELSGLDEVAERAKYGRPTFVVHFPAVYAEAYEEAGDLAETYSRNLGDLLALRRGAAMEIIGGVLVDVNGRMFHKIYAPHYGGNILGGVMSGEDPKEITEQLSRLEVESELHLYLALFQEALRESRVDFAYFRYWNLLETIARAEGLEECMRYEWYGKPVTGKRGKHLRSEGAADWVFELLRGHLTGVSETCFGRPFGDLVTIWCKHRGCAVHRGGCRPDDPAVCDRQNPDSDSHMCYEATMSVPYPPDTYSDILLRALRETTRIVLERLIDAWPRRRSD